MHDLTEFAPLADFQQENPNIARSIDSLRWMIRHRKENGLVDAGAVMKRQGRWYVHSGRFARWMMSGAEDHQYAA